jgi:hypothetical protein
MFRVPDGVDAMVNSMQPSARDPSIDHAVRQPDFEQLRYRDHTVLTGSEGGNRGVETTRPRANGLKSTYAVDLTPEAGHAAHGGPDPRTDQRNRVAGGRPICVESQPRRGR